MPTPRIRTSKAIIATSNFRGRQGFGNSEFSGTGYLFNTSKVTDATHPLWVFGDRDLDNGGNFDLISETYRNISPAHMSDVTNAYNYAYGDVWPVSYLGNAFGGIPIDAQGEDPPAALSESQLLAQGTTGMSRALPTNPVFGTSRALGELRNDGLPAMVNFRILKEKSKLLKNSGGEYLNVEFGWLPLISDLTNFAKAVKSSSKLVSQFRKSSDTKVKRRYNFPSASTTKRHAGGGTIMGPYDPYVGGFWHGASSTTSQHATSFSGAFRYHIPTGNDLPSRMAGWESEANKLLGLRLTPKVVWDLAPWTWAYDWFSNTGDVLRNISNLGADGLVMQYGYVMDGLITSQDIAAYYDNIYNGSHWACSVTKDTKNLRRRSASWYGFGFSIPTLSPTQDAVLVALGLSHGLR